MHRRVEFGVSVWLSLRRKAASCRVKVTWKTGVFLLHGHPCGTQTARLHPCFMTQWGRVREEVEPATPNLPKKNPQERRPLHSPQQTAEHLFSPSLPTEPAWAAGRCAVALLILLQRRSLSVSSVITQPPMCAPNASTSQLCSSPPLLIEGSSDSKRAMGPLPAAHTARQATLKELLQSDLAHRHTNT